MDGTGSPGMRTASLMNLPSMYNADGSINETTTQPTLSINTLRKVGNPPPRLPVTLTIAESETPCMEGRLGEFGGDVEHGGLVYKNASSNTGVAGCWRNYERGTGSNISPSRDVLV
ncbi:hypothetical protein CBL_05289 [Carabus blaptoides fortunei]